MSDSVHPIMRMALDAGLAAAGLPPLKRIEQRPIARPKYINTPGALSSFQAWYRLNQAAVIAHWQALSDGVPPVLDDYARFCKCQYDIQVFEMRVPLEKASGGGGFWCERCQHFYSGENACPRHS